MKILKPICFFFLLIVCKFNFSQIDTSLFYGIYKYSNEFQTSILYFEKGGVCIDTIHGAISSLATGTYFFDKNKMIATFIKSDNTKTKRIFFLVQGNKGKVSLEEEFKYITHKKIGLRKEKKGVIIYRKVAELTTDK